MKKIPAILPVAALAAALVAGAATRSPKGEIARNLDTFTSIYKVLQTSLTKSTRTRSISLRRTKPSS